MSNGNRGRLRPWGRVRALAFALSFIVCIAPLAASAETTGKQAGIGIGAALASLVYGPVKICYAALGTIFGGMAWGLSGGDADVANAVITPAVRGDYVVTPSNLRGEPLEFIGRRPGYEAEAIVMEEDFDTTY